MFGVDVGIKAREILKAQGREHGAQVVFGRADVVGTGLAGEGLGAVVQGRQ